MHHTVVAFVSPLARFLTPIPFAGLVVVVALLWLCVMPTRVQRALRHLPRPQTAWPFVGDTLTVLFRHRQTMPTWMYEECLRLHGQPFVVELLSKPTMVALSSVEAMEDVLKLQQVDSFVKGDEFTQALSTLFGNGIFNTDGDVWHQQRKTASRFFAPHIVRDVMDGVMVSTTERLCSVLTEAARRQDRVDIKHLLELFATDVFTAIGFGVDLDFLTNDNTEFFARFGRANAHTLFRQQQPAFVWKLLRALDLGYEKQHREDVAWLDTFVYKLIQDTMARPPSPMTTPHDIVSLFMTNHEDGDVAAIRDMTMAFISAGRDTTAYSMTWFLVMMAQHPHEQRKIRQELREKLPQLFTGDLIAPNKDLTNDLVYLEAAIRENLRLNTVIPLNTRESTRDVTLRDGTFLPAGVKILFSPYAMARLPWIWGQDAREYKPSRWLDAKGDLVTVSPFKFLTFSAGPRICPGKQFSIHEMKIALAAVLSKFDITTEADPHSFAYDPSLALGIQGPVYMRPTFVSF